MKDSNVRRVLFRSGCYWEREGEGDGEGEGGECGGGTSYAYVEIQQ
jgi:hypothetical protein